MRAPIFVTKEEVENSVYSDMDEFLFSISAELGCHISCREVLATQRYSVYYKGDVEKQDVKAAIDRRLDSQIPIRDFWSNEKKYKRRTKELMSFDHGETVQEMNHTIDEPQMFVWSDVEVNSVAKIGGVR